MTSTVQESLVLLTATNYTYIARAVVRPFVTISAEVSTHFQRLCPTAYRCAHFPPVSVPLAHQPAQLPSIAQTLSARPASIERLSPLRIFNSDSDDSDFSITATFASPLTILCFPSPTRFFLLSLGLSISWLSFWCNSLSSILQSHRLALTLLVGAQATIYERSRFSSHSVRITHSFSMKASLAILASLLSLAAALPFSPVGPCADVRLLLYIQWLFSMLTCLTGQD